jgi:hypothetical protein
LASRAVITRQRRSSMIGRNTKTRNRPWLSPIATNTRLWRQITHGPCRVRSTSSTDTPWRAMWSIERAVRRMRGHTRARSTLRSFSAAPMSLAGPSMYQGDSSTRPALEAPHGPVRAPGAVCRKVV